MSGKVDRSVRRNELGLRGVKDSDFGRWGKDVMKSMHEGIRKEGGVSRKELMLARKKERKEVEALERSKQSVTLESSASNLQD